nr:hypothetical protein [Pandoravirus aubagnensis]
MDARHVVAPAVVHDTRRYVEIGPCLDAAHDRFVGTREKTPQSPIETHVLGQRLFLCVEVFVDTPRVAIDQRRVDLVAGATAVEPRDQSVVPRAAVGVFSGRVGSRADGGDALFWGARSGRPNGRSTFGAGGLLSGSLTSSRSSLLRFPARETLPRANGPRHCVGIALLLCARPARTVEIHPCRLGVAGSLLRCRLVVHVLGHFPFPFFSFFFYAFRHCR